MEAEKGNDPLEGLERVTYPSKEQLQNGSHQEPSQKMGDYAVIRSESETGRVFTAVKDLGAKSDIGAQVPVATVPVATVSNLVGFGFEYLLQVPPNLLPSFPLVYGSWRTWCLWRSWRRVGLRIGTD